MADPKAAQEARRILGLHLAGARHQAGLTQSELAVAIHYSRSTIGNVETGQQKINREFWMRCDEDGRYCSTISQSPARTSCPPDRREASTCSSQQ